jgi:hypothetical protein
MALRVLQHPAKARQAQGISIRMTIGTARSPACADLFI